MLIQGRSGGFYIYYDPCAWRRIARGAVLHAGGNHLAPLWLQLAQHDLEGPQGAPLIEDLEGIAFLAMHQICF